MRGDELTLDQVQEKFGQIATLKEAFYDWGGLNTSLFKLINGYHGDAYDAFMLFVTQLGNKHFFPIYLGVLLFYVFLFGGIRKIRGKGAVRQHFIMWVGVFAVLIAGFGATAFVTHFLKEYFELPRPGVVLSHEAIIVEKADTQYSFPSGHVAVVTLLIAGMWPVLADHMRKLGVFLIFLVGFSRVALGVHFPADAVWSAIITLLLVIFVRFVIYKILRQLGVNCGGG